RFESASQAPPRDGKATITINESSHQPTAISANLSQDRPEGPYIAFRIQSARKARLNRYSGKAKRLGRQSKIASACQARGPLPMNRRPKKITSASPNASAPSRIATRTAGSSGGPSQK